jgi:Uma2 family endonuclease
MQMAATLRKWTLAEFHRLPDDGNKYELVRGRLLVTPAPLPRHEGLANDLAAIIGPYVVANGLGAVFRPRAAVRLEDSEVEPDLMVRHSPRPLPATWEEMPPPILVVEVLSDSTRRRALLHKRALYLDNGIPALWQFDPVTRTVRVARPGQPDEVASDLLAWQPAGASEPLVIDVGALFRSVLGPTPLPTKPVGHSP